MAFLPGFHRTGPALLIIASLGGAAAAGDTPKTLSLEDRVVAQRAIEQVYWSHRIWPRENGLPKPALDAVMPDEVLRARVDDYLRESNALEDVWGRPITAEQLQAEMQRMARESRDPGTLRELFDALGNDPLVIAETLARQALADRLIRSWYARDERFHGELRRRAVAALSHATHGSDLRSLGGEYAKTTWRLRQGDGVPENRPGEIDLDPEEWQSRLGRLAIALGATANVEALPRGIVTPIEETDTEFFAESVLESGASVVKVATIAWPKLAFDEWWARQRTATSRALRQPKGAFSPAAVSASPCSVDTWTATPAPPEARDHHSAVWTGAEMIVWGGFGINATRNSGGRYSPSTDTWVATSSENAPQARQRHTAVWTGTEMIVWGGTDSGAFLVTGGRYNPSTNSWTATSTTSAPSARDACTAAWTGSVLIVWGGYNGGVFVNTGARYNPSSDTWIATTTSGAPSARGWHAAVWTGSVMIVWGGTSASGYRSDGSSYSPSADNWTAITTANAPTARAEHKAVWTGTVMIVWGGYNANGQYLNAGGRYNPSTDTWTATTTVGAPVGRIDYGLVWTGTVMIVWGGSAGSSNGLGNGGRYNPATDVWTATSQSGAPSTRLGLTAVWTGGEMIVWGGRSDNGNFNNGARYNPSADSWVPTSNMGAPNVQYGHSAVWTGAEMIVWGGLGGIQVYLATGSRYSPATNHWAPTSNVGAPAGRYLHRAIWTGSEMIVWGGQGGPNGFFLPIGGRYSPSMDSWTQTTGTNVPTLAYPSAVWTGTEMIVWGGLTTAGGRYNPSTDSWTGTSQINAPARREGGTAVWTGAEMIVWGGRTFDPTPIYLGNGGRYNPSTDSWVPTPLSSPRAFHTAVWTGGEMLVWGGYTGGSYFDTGGRYDPYANVWTATSTVSAPEPRIQHTAVWTGSEMIVWGGGRDTGGRYTPATESWEATSTGEGVPSPRGGNTAVWSGTEMIVWGPGNTGGRYCAAACDSPSVWYQDHDGDGNGTSSVPQLACTQPAGFVAASGDCNDLSAAIHPGAPETCNGIDDNCDAVVDNDGGALCSDGDPCTHDACTGAGGCTHVPEAPAEVDDGLRVDRTGTDAALQWNLATGATASDVVRGSLGAFPVGPGGGDEDCLGDNLASNTLTDATVPPEDAGYWYLVRGVTACAPGPYGFQTTNGVPAAARTSTTCP